MPKVLKESSVPLNSAFFHLPVLRELCACGILREMFNIKQIVSSATALVLPKGAHLTTTPFSEAASKSMLS